MGKGIERAVVGELELAHESFGEPGDEPLLLVMGLATQMLGWDERFCRLLADEGFHVVRFDNRDIGLSTHLDDGPAYTLLEMADDTAGLIDALGWRSAHVVGASMGGMIAQQLAIGHPSRVRSLTSIMSTPFREIGAARPEAMAALMLPPPTDEDEAVQRSVQVYRVIGSPGYALDEERLGEVARESFRRALDPAGVARQFAAILASPDRRPGLRGLDLPTLVLHGEDDPLVQVDGGIATADAVPGARLVTVPGMGHNLPEPLWPMLVEEIVRLARNSDARPA